MVKETSAAEPARGLDPAFVAEEIRAKDQTVRELLQILARFEVAADRGYLVPSELEPLIREIRPNLSTPDLRRYEEMVRSARAASMRFVLSSDPQQDERDAVWVEHLDPEASGG